MHHLVTGGSGFLGNLIAQRLAARGERVTVLDVWEDPQRKSEIAYVHCDIRDRAGVAAAMRGVDVVHHNVALVPLTKSGQLFREVNVDGARIAAEEAARAGVRAFVHMSSSAIFGHPPACPIPPDASAHPIEIYGRAKWDGERAVREVAEQSSMSLIVIRPRTILGQGRLGIFEILFDWIRQGRNVYVIGSGNVPFQFVHADDLMDAYLLVLDRGGSGAFNVGTDRYGTLRQALETLIAYAGTTSRVRSLPQGLTITLLRMLDALRLSPLAPWHYLTYHKPFAFDVTPLLDLGWRPRYSNDEMFRESYDWFLQHGHEKPSAGAATGSPHRKAVKQGILKLVRLFS